MVDEGTAGERNVTVLQASIHQRALDGVLVDKILIHLAPIMIGEGIRC